MLLLLPIRREDISKVVESLEDAGHRELAADIVNLLADQDSEIHCFFRAKAIEDRFREGETEIGWDALVMPANDGHGAYVPAYLWVQSTFGDPCDFRYYNPLKGK